MHSVIRVDSMEDSTTEDSIMEASITEVSITADSTTEVSTMEASTESREEVKYPSQYVTFALNISYSSHSFHYRLRSPLWIR